MDLDALLKQIQPRRPLDDDKPHGYLESDVDWMLNNREVLIQIMEEATKPDPNENHVYCRICRECITCNLRPCHNGRTHIPEQE